MISVSIFRDFGGLGINLHVDLGPFFGAQTCCLACLVASPWHPGGPWDDLGTLGSMTKDRDFEVQLCIFNDFL